MTQVQLAHTRLRAILISAAGQLYDRYAGLSRLMRLQQILPKHGGQVGNPFVAVQRGFSIADAHSLPNRQNPIRSFAAPWADVSHADKAA